MGSQADDEFLAAYAAGFEKEKEVQDNKLLNDFMDLYDPPPPPPPRPDEDEQTKNDNIESYLTLSQALNMLSCTQTDDEEDESTADKESDYERTPLDERFADVRDEAGCFEPACSDFEGD
jgi:hypothetical protein